MIEEKKFAFYDEFMCRFLYIIIIFSLCCPFLPVSAAIRVVDGDSLEDGVGRIRLDGIDAPEFMQMCRRASGEEYACGQDAYDYLKSLLAQGETVCHCLDKPDKYGRKLCECFVDGMSLNKQMVAAGYAVTYRSDKYIADEKNAVAEKVGIWQGKYMRPALYRVLERLREKTESH